MSYHVSQLSALPGFLRQNGFWKGALDPRGNFSGSQRRAEYRCATGSHRWGIRDLDVQRTPVADRRAKLVDIAQGLLERGLWTLPSWRIEQYLGNLFVDRLDWKLVRPDARSGDLRFRIELADLNRHFEQALVSARWGCEASGADASDIWASQPAVEKGSEAERRFLEQVLVPVLGYPLLDYLHLQRELVGLGLDHAEFARQRTDFALDNLHGLKLVVEIDGDHHKGTQADLDTKRDRALHKAGWQVWRVTTPELADVQNLQSRLAGHLRDSKGKLHWGVEQQIASPRSRDLLTGVWGATVVARIQFLLLEAVREGVLPWEMPWEIVVREHDTDIAREAIEDFVDWFGRLCAVHGEGGPAGVHVVAEARPETTHLLIDLAVLTPHRPEPLESLPVAWSRPANRVATVPKRKFTVASASQAAPPRGVLDSFVQDLFRKEELREGQYEILERILSGRDVVGLLPTGAGKSLTYQLAGLLLGGMTVYIAPIKSLLQDQHERLSDLGIDLAQPISSALDAHGRRTASDLFAGGGVRFLLVAPERFLMAAFQADLGKFRTQFGEVCQVVIDECHCVSEWGHDFRPAYLSVSRIAKARTRRFGAAAPLVALTGTASTVVLADVQRELGIPGATSVVRAKRLDRDEIVLECIKLAQNQKHTVLPELVGEFIREHPDPSEGLLIFCPFAGGKEGVLGIHADLVGIVGSDQIRFFCGEVPKWGSYAAFVTKTAAKDISRSQALDHVPWWALLPDGQTRDWEEVKANVQRQYLGGGSGSFRVMVATKAFGMGIDKPSIRRVIHFMSPQSPEAYYQEVGRAGRDRVSSLATLLFSDEEPALIDRILSPETSIDDARREFETFADANRFKGGDFVRTFYFHHSAFAGGAAEVDCICRALAEIRTRLEVGSSMSLPYLPEARGGEGGATKRRDWNSEKALEYAIVRLMMLGVLREYTKDYKGKTFDLTLAGEWEAVRFELAGLKDHLLLHFQEYVKRYRVRRALQAEESIRAADSVPGAERAAATALVGYVYDQIERERRQASRQMLELARKGVADQEAFRRDLMLYLQASERFTDELEALARSEEASGWREIIHRARTPDEMRELHGACSRVLESYPTHPGLLCISALTRTTSGAEDTRLGNEEFRAALRLVFEGGGLAEAKALGDAVSDLSQEIESTLVESLHVEYSVWLMQNGREREAIDRFFVRESVRHHWMARTLRAVQESLPSVRGL